jgi:nitrogen regulatory protein PII
METAYSGQHGDGKVYIMDMLEGGRVSTRERDPDLG